MQPEVYEAMDQIARDSPLEGAKVMSYRQCLAMLGYGGLLAVDIEEVCEWAKYIARADGKGDEPHCVAILILDPEVANIYDGNTARQLSVASLCAILPDSVDKPLVLEFPDIGECTDSSRYASCEPNYILDMIAGPDL